MDSLNSIDTKKLELLANWIDKLDIMTGDISSDVQDDLRKWAKIIRENNDISNNLSKINNSLIEINKTLNYMCETQNFQLNRK